MCVKTLKSIKRIVHFKVLLFHGLDSVSDVGHSFLLWGPMGLFENVNVMGSLYRKNYILQVPLNSGHLLALTEHSLWIYQMIQKQFRHSTQNSNWCPQGVKTHIRANVEQNPSSVSYLLVDTLNENSTYSVHVLGITKFAF